MHISVTTAAGMPRPPARWMARLASLRQARLCGVDLMFGSARVGGAAGRFGASPLLCHRLPLTYVSLEYVHISAGAGGMGTESFCYLHVPVFPGIALYLL